MPDLDRLPRGPLRDLVLALHELYEGAGVPSLRNIEKAIKNGDYRDSASHTQISEFLHGNGTPAWGKLETVVRVLASWQTPPLDPEEEAVHFNKLWQKAHQADHGNDKSEQPKRLSSVKSIYVIGAVTGETSYPAYEQAQLAETCKDLGAAIARGGADLIVCSPFDDSADFYALMGYIQSGVGRTVHLHSPRHPRVEDHERQLRIMLNAQDSEQIKNWHYPGPSSDEREAWGQAWLLCQLMALDRADVVVAVGGRPDKTANTLLHLAEARQIPVVPFGFLGGAAARAFERRDWGKTDPSLHKRLLDRNSVTDVMDIANRLVSTRIRTAGNYTWPPRHVFISRARSDAEAAHTLEAYLTDSGITVLIGEKEILPDRTVEIAIADALLRADMFIVLWSRAYATSRFCYDELDLAMERHKIGELQVFVIGLDDSDVVHRDARALPRVEARTPDDLIDRMRSLMDSPIDATHD